jgi:cell division protein FtsL
MLLKLILCVLALTIVGCFYSQTNQILDLENKVESLESDIKTVNEILDEFDEVFILLIEEIRKQKSYNLAKYYK